MRRGRPLSDNRSPYRLHETLKTHQIAHSELRRAIQFETGTRAGEPIACSTLSHLLVQRVWPSTIGAKTIQDQVAKFLRERGISEQEIADAWTTADGVEDSGPPFDRPLLFSRPDPKATTEAAAEAPFELPEPEMLTDAAKELFRLPRQPFKDDVNTHQDVFISGDQRYVRESMYYAAKHSGFIAVVGESGSGKSTLRRDLIERIRRDQESIVIIQPKTIDKSVLTAAHICDAIVADLSTERPKLSLEAKGRQVERILAASARTGNAHVLMIEEAHDLAISTLKYLKRFWELEDGFKKLLGVVLVGQPELGDRLDERRNYDAREVIRRCEVARLKPLNNNLEAYLELKFKRIGVKPETVLAPDAYDGIRNKLTRRRQGNAEVESHVYPLVVNNLVTKAMNQAAELGMDRVDAELIGRM